MIVDVETIVMGGVVLGSCVTAFTVLKTTSVTRDSCSKRMTDMHQKIREDEHRTQDQFLKIMEALGRIERQNGGGK